MSRQDIRKALRALIQYKRSRLAVGFWSDMAPGLVAIDKTLKAFKVEVSS